MPRNPRVDLKNYIYHVINRANARIKIFEYKQDYELFEKTINEAKEKWHIHIYSYIIMPNHFHIVLSPIQDGNVAKFMYFLTMTFTQRWHSLNHTVGTGHLFQGRYKSFIVENDTYLLQLLLYVERNALNALLVEQAQAWRWSSLWIRLNGTKIQKQLLSEWPIDMPKNYLDMLNDDVPERIFISIMVSINKSVPFGSETWKNNVIKKHRLESVLRSSGRPKKIMK